MSDPMTAEHQLHDSAGAAGQAVKDGDQRSESSPADPILRWRRSAFGVPFEVTFVPGAFRPGRLDDPPASERLRRVLPPHRTPTEEAPQISFTIVGRGPAKVDYSNSAGEVHTGIPLADALAHLDLAMRLHLALTAPGALFIHAGAVELDGSAVLFPGASRAGKSTLVRALVDAGCGYLSDEFAVLDVVGRVRPYARHLAMREPWGGKMSLDPRTLTGPVVTNPLPVAAIIDLQFVDGETLVVHPLSAAEAAMALVANAVAARSRSSEVLKATAAAARTSVALRGHRGDVDIAVRPLLEHLRALIADQLR